MRRTERKHTVAGAHSSDPVPRSTAECARLRQRDDDGAVAAGLRESRWRPLALILSLLIHGFGMTLVQRKHRAFQRLARFHFPRQLSASTLILMLAPTHFQRLTAR
jgi:hypothetical protein